jgi:hypothetical protein
MYVTDHGDRVRVRWPVYSDPDAYLVPLHELVAASENYDAHQGDLGTRDLRPFADRVAAAEADVEEAFTEDYTIAHAERVYAALGAAIVRAKVARGDFNYRRGDDE